MAFWRVFALAGVLAGSGPAQNGFYLHDGDRVVFYGDSITDQRLYTTFVETYAVTRFPGEHFTFVHSGWGGDRVTGGGGGPVDLRLERDVFAYRPTVMTIMLGMNDASYRAFDQGLYDTYINGYQHIVSSVKKEEPGIRITAILPSPYDDVTQTPTFEGGYNAVLERYAEGVKTLAATDHIDTADMNGPVVEDLKKAFAMDPAGAKKLIPDRVHPGPAGHMLMAEALLKAWRAPAMVSDVEIDVAAGKVRKSANASVGDLDGASWMETEKALPMPIDWRDASTQLAMKASDFVDALDEEILTVKGLKRGKWTLTIDGKEAGSFESEELAHGINLVKFETPMMDQARAVAALTKKHTDLHNTRWRNIQVPLARDPLPDRESAMALLDRMEAEIVHEQHEAAQPVAHKFVLVSE
jgi:lysophospholipase L1-like esterase